MHFVSRLERESGCRDPRDIGAPIQLACLFPHRAVVNLAAGQEEVLKVFSVCLMFASDVPNLSFAAVDTVVRPFVCLCQTRRAVR